MLGFADLIAPLSQDDFLTKFYGKRPAHLPAQADVSRRVLSWTQLNEALALGAHWSDRNLKLVREGATIDRAYYCEQAYTAEGPKWRPDPAKVKLFMGMGASLIANDIQATAPALHAVGDAISAVLGGAVNANCYVSSGGVGGFDVHYDTTDVIALHCEGEKVWRFYEGRADAPLDPPTGSQEELRAYYRGVAGRAVQEVRMRPGDALYIPRGHCHDALAQTELSMHVTFAIALPTGRILLGLLQTIALEDRAFRANFPDGIAATPEVVSAYLEALGDKLRKLVASPRMAAEMREQAAALRPSRLGYDLPNRQIVKLYRATGTAIEMIETANGYKLRVAGQEAPIGAAWKAALWLATRPSFSDGELYAGFQTVPAEALDSLIADLVRLGAFAPL